MVLRQVMCLLGGHLFRYQGRLFDYRLERCERCGKYRVVSDVA